MAGSHSGNWGVLWGGEHPVNGVAVIASGDDVGHEEHGEVQGKCQYQGRRKEWAMIYEGGWRKGRKEERFLFRVSKESGKLAKNCFFFFISE